MRVSSPGKLREPMVDALGPVMRRAAGLLGGLGRVPVLELLRTHDPHDLLELAHRALPGLLRRDGG